MKAIIDTIATIGDWVMYLIIGGLLVFLAMLPPMCCWELMSRPQQEKPNRVFQVDCPDQQTWISEEWNSKTRRTRDPEGNRVWVSSSCTVTELMRTE